MERLVTSLNWGLGALAVIAAIGYGIINDMVVFASARSQGESVIASIASAERDNFALREKYVQFGSDQGSFTKAMSALGLNIRPDKFTVSAYADEGNALVIRAVTTPDMLRGGWYPPMEYVFKIQNAGGAGSGEWIMFSKQKPGIF